MLKAYERALKQRPLVTKMVTSAVLSASQDIIAQLVAARRAAAAATSATSASAARLDAARSGKMLLAGGLIDAPLSHALFSLLNAAFASWKDGPAKTIAQV